MVAKTICDVSRAARSRLADASPSIIIMLHSIGTCDAWPKPVLTVWSVSLDDISRVQVKVHMRKGIDWGKMLIAKYTQFACILVGLRYGDETQEIAEYFPSNLREFLKIELTHIAIYSFNSNASWRRRQDLDTLRLRHLLCKTHNLHFLAPF